MSPLEIVAVVISFAGIWLTAQRRMLSWPVNLLACALYFELFREVRLYADMGLQALFGLAGVYGWFAWAHNKAEAGAVIVARLSRLRALAGLALGAVGAALLGYLLRRYTNAALPWLDSALTSFSLVAQYWTARRYAASWLLWIAVDIVYVGLFLSKGLLPTTALYAAITVLAGVGYFRWQAGSARHHTA